MQRRPEKRAGGSIGVQGLRTRAAGHVDAHPQRRLPPAGPVPQAARRQQRRPGNMARARSDAPTPRRPSRPTVPRPLQPADAGRGSGSCAPCRARRRKRRERVRAGPRSAGRPCARARHGAGRRLVLGGSTRADHGPPARVGRSLFPPPPHSHPPKLPLTFKAFPAGVNSEVMRIDRVEGQGACSTPPPAAHRDPSRAPGSRTPTKPPPARPRAPAGRRALRPTPPSGRPRESRPGRHPVRPPAGPPSD